MLQKKVKQKNKSMKSKVLKNKKKILCQVIKKRVKS